MKKFIVLVLLSMICGSFIKGQASFNRDELLVSDFDDLQLETDSYWNGSDLSGGFTSGPVFFNNYFDESFGTWGGWAYSNMANDSTPGYANQYSAITAQGWDPVLSGGPNYAVAWVPNDWVTGEQVPVTIDVTNEEAREVLGFFVTNSTYAALSMEFGDDFAKKFGGESGDDPDWFMLYAWGYDGGTATDTIKFYLADYRFDDNDEDYIVNTWEWVDLSTLGIVDSLKFKLDSSDTGMFGINTPTYFCMDDLTFERESSSVAEKAGGKLVEILPNPSNGRFRIGIDGSAAVTIFDLAGGVVYRNENYYAGQMVDVTNRPAGMYIIRISSGELTSSSILVKD
jgi:hypothetical protein